MLVIFRVILNGLKNSETNNEYIYIHINIRSELTFELQYYSFGDQTTTERKICFSVCELTSELTGQLQCLGVYLGATQSAPMFRSLSRSLP